MTASAANPNDRLGISLAVTAAAGLGLAIAVSRFAYDGGTNGLTVATTRALVALAGLFLFCRLTGRRLWIPLRMWLHCAGLGVLMSMMFYGNVGAVEFISVGLAALLFYTFPPMVAVISAVVLREIPALPKALAVVIAFLGIALMLGVSLENTDPRGVVLALSAGAATAWNSVWLARKVAHIDPLVVTFHMASIAALVLVCISLFSGSVQFPTALAGWLGMMGVVVLQSSSLPLYFVAIPKIGPLKSAMVSNIQPVVSIVAAFFWFGEILTPVQFLGGGMVLCGIWLMQWHDGRHARASTAT